MGGLVHHSSDTTISSQSKIRIEIGRRSMSLLWGVRRVKASVTSLRRCLSTVDRGTFAGLPGLVSPSDWQKLGRDAESKCHDLVNQAITETPSINTIRILDEISDTLCQVIDAAEFCRNVHVDEQWRSAADKICIDLGSFVQELNTHYALYTTLKASLPTLENPTPQIKSTNDELSFREESLQVGKMLLRDFERYGVHLTGEKKDRMSALVATTQFLGFQYTQNIINPDQCGRIIVSGHAMHAVQSLPYHIRKSFQPVQGISQQKENNAATDSPLYSAPSIQSPATITGALSQSTSHRIKGSIDALQALGTGSTLNALMWYSDNESLRKEAYVIYNTTPTDNRRILDELVEHRHEMASLMGFTSFSSYQLDQCSLAGDPSTVSAFLKTLSEAMAPALEGDAAQLASIKRKVENDMNVTPGTSPVRPWDRHWAVAKAMESNTLLASSLAAISDYITLDGCIRGLSHLLEELMGVELREESPPTGELWAPGVRKLAVHHTGEGPLGVVYLDLYKRANKFPGAAHFTLRCGRKKKDSSYQTPVVALVANMAASSPSSCSWMGLSHSELETFLHEFGHALNSLLSRTYYQHLSGTRGPQDIIEIPSHVFERFACDPDALKIFARYSRSDHALALPEGPPDELLDAVAASKRHFVALQLEHTLQLSMIDQLLHGESPPIGEEATACIAGLLEKHSVLGYQPGTYPHLRFPHIVGYGANYYCYLFAQCFAAAIWNDAPSKCGGNGWPGGALLRRKILEPGGAKQARHYIEDIFGERASDVLISSTSKSSSGCYPAVDSLMHHLRLDAQN